MRIIFTIQHALDTNAGAPGATADLASEMARLGHESRVFSFDDLPQRLSERAKTVTFPWFVRRHLNGMASHMAVDVIDSSEGDTLLCRHRGRVRPLRVFRSHGLGYLERAEHLEEASRGHVQLSWKYHLYSGSIRPYLGKIACRNADVVCVPNEYERESLIETLGIDADRIRIYRHGLRETFLGLPAPQAPPGARIGIAQVGTYNVRKGICYGTDALNRVLQRHENVHVGLFGVACPAHRVLDDFDPGVRHRVAVVERYERDDLPALLEGFQIKLFPSVFEGFGLALLEAMACGLGPVVTAIPGPADLVEDGRNALVVPARDSGALQAAMEWLIADPPLLEHVRQEAHRTAQAYTWRRSAEEALALYREFLGRVEDAPHAASRRNEPARV